MERRPRVLISPLIAHSIINQTDLIKKLLDERGYDAEYRTHISGHDVRDPSNVAFLWAKLGLIEFLGGVSFPWILARESYDKGAVIYVTVEGVPTRANVLYSPLANLEFVANSKFTRDCLTQAGLRVVDVVHHGVDVNEAKKAHKRSRQLAEKLERQYPGRCRFAWVGRDDPRKGLDKLSQAVSVLNEAHQDEFVVILHTQASARRHFKQPNVVVIPEFGNRPHLEVMSFLAACHFLVFPSMSEGFGLPLLEANAVGRPAIHCMFPPLSEFSSADFNWVWDYSEKRLAKPGASQYWIFHEYPPEVLADAMLDAMGTWRKDREQYDEYCAKAREHANRWDYRRVYEKLLRCLKIA